MNLTQSIFDPLQDKPKPGQVFKIQSPRLPEFLFEYHPTSQKVYSTPIGKTIVKDGQTYHEATLLAEHIPDPMWAKGIVKAFVEGYVLGQQQPRELVTRAILT